MSTSELTFSCRYPISVVAHIHLLVNICLRSDVFLLLVLFTPIFVFFINFSVVKLVLSPHWFGCSSTWSHWPLSIRSLCNPRIVVEVVEVVEHQVHVLFLFILQVVNDPLVFVYFNSDVGVWLSRYSSGFDEVVMIHCVASLSCWNFRS